MMERTSKKKRKHPTVDKAELARKRQKPTPSIPVAHKRRAVSVNALQWKKVEIPEMFDDAEGFYGLEVIEGVEIVRNGDNVEFVVADSAANDTTPSIPTDNADDDGEEFEGFSDPPKSGTGQTTLQASSGPTHSKPTTENAKKKADGKDTAAVTLKKKTKAKDDKGALDTKAKSKKEKKEKSKVSRPADDDMGLESNVFSALQDAAEEKEEVDMSAWMALDLSPQMVSTIAHLKFLKPTAIQASAVPEVMAGHDVIGKASTGSGKTLAFAIPIVEKWLELQERDSTSSPNTKSPLALVLSPTRELAHQITNHFKDLCAALPTSPYVCSVTGGLSVHKQQRQLVKADIVIGTPGRLWEVLSSSTSLLTSFKQIKFLVVDEADRILTDGHFKEAEEIFEALDRFATEEDEEDEHSKSARQTLVFSATFHKGLQQKLAGKGKYGLMSDEESMEYLLKRLNFREEHPKFIDVNPVSQMAEGLKEGLLECGAMEKDLYLYTLLLMHPNRRTLVFTNSISSARRLTPMLQNLNLNALPLHSQMAQKARLRSVEKFTSSKPNTSCTLIATDVAARGLDIPNIDQVIHYHVPRTADAYVHRSGRTARAQKIGLSVLLCGPEEVTPTRRLAAKVHLKRAAKKQYMIRTIDIDRKLASRLKPRVDLAKKIADSMLAKEKGNKDDDWARTAAEELGVEYDSEELDNASNWGGRGSGRKKKEKEARELTKAELGVLRAQLRELLSRRVNSGVSEKYITGGRLDINELLRGGTESAFLGRVDGLDLDDL